MYLLIEKKIEPTKHHFLADQPAILRVAMNAHFCAILKRTLRNARLAFLRRWFYTFDTTSFFRPKQERNWYVIRYALCLCCCCGDVAKRRLIN